MNDTFKLKTEAVTRVYSGKNGKCCCGCSGKYTERGEPSFAGKLTLLAKHVEATPAGDVDVGPNYVGVIVGSRLHLAYFD